jgi:hypothetical protein
MSKGKKFFPSSTTSTTSTSIVRNGLFLLFSCRVFGYFERTSEEAEESTSKFKIPKTKQETGGRTRRLEQVLGLEAAGSHHFIRIYNVRVWWIE